MEETTTLASEVNITSLSSQLDTTNALLLIIIIFAIFVVLYKLLYSLLNSFI